MHFILKWEICPFFRRSSRGKNKTPCYTYASLSHDQLADAISRIAKRLGYDNAKFAQEELEKRIIIK
jgi:tRNA 2-selenouridine synthase